MINKVLALILISLVIGCSPSNNNSFDPVITVDTDVSILETPRTKPLSATMSEINELCDYDELVRIAREAEINKFGDNLPWKNLEPYFLIKENNILLYYFQPNRTVYGGTAEVTFDKKNCEIIRIIRFQ